MAQWTWTYDAPTGTYKNHALTDELRYAAVAATEFAGHVRVVDGFGRRKGDTVTIVRVRNITEPTSGLVSETGKIPIDTFALSTVPITVSEFGRGVEFSHFSDILSKYDLKNPIQRKLRDQMGLVLDTRAATAFKTAKLTYVPTSLTGGTLETGGAATATATSNLTFRHLGDLRDRMRQDYHIPFYGEGHYVGLLSTKAARGIKLDTNFQEMTKYLRPGQLVYNSEIGKAEQIRVSEVNHATALSNSVGTDGVLGQAVIFGEDGVGMAEVETPELRMAIPAEFGRQHAVAWYGIFEYGIIWDTANDGEARIIFVTSA